MNFFTPKFMKIRCLVPLFKTFDNHIYIKWAIHGLILIFKFVTIHVQEVFSGRRSRSKYPKLQSIHFLLKKIEDFNVNLSHIEDFNM
jgi:hypothetical protein